MWQTWVETSQYPCVISPNSVGHGEKVMKHSNVALSSICAWCIPLLYRWYSYLGIIQVTAPVGNSSYISSRETCGPVCEGNCPVRKRNLFFDYQKCQQLRLTGVAEGYWHIRGGPFSSGLPEGALFTQILCKSLFRLCTLSDISAYLTRIVETETTRVSIGCHSIRTVLVVR